MQIDKPVVICLTPVKNESWILDRFLQATSLWADHIIIADQNSTDNSLEIAEKFPKVIVIKNQSIAFNETERQKMLLDAARKIPGKRILVTLDADEFLTANFVASKEWKTVLNAAPGSLISFNWVNIDPGFETAYIDQFQYRWAFVDDGTEHEAVNKIHSQRLPFPKDSCNIHLKEIKILHYAYVHPARTRSKHRWYMCWELLNIPKQTPYGIYKKYFNHSKAIGGQYEPLKREWFDAYQEQNIDMTSVTSQSKHIGYPGERSHPLFEYFWWDKDIVQWIEEHGARKFALLDIWDFDWRLMAHDCGKQNLKLFEDPRTRFDKWIFKLISNSVRGEYSAPINYFVQFFLFRIIFRFWR